MLIAVALSILDLLRRVARPHDGILGYVPGVAGMHDVDDYPDAEPVPGLLVYRYDAPLCFANADNFRTRALAAIDLGGGDTSSGSSSTPRPTSSWTTSPRSTPWRSCAKELGRRGIVFAMARVKQDLREGLSRYGVLPAGLVGPDLRDPADDGRGVPGVGGQATVEWCLV